jgi:hypothetical protein
MDHIPHPLHPTRHHDEVPYQVRDLHRYDAAGFGGFPAHHGFTISLRPGPYLKKSDGNEEDVSFEDACSLIQAWLYFGLLEATAKDLEMPFSSELFIRSGDEGVRWVNSHSLPHVIGQFALFELDEPLNKPLFEARRAGLISLQDNLSIVQSFILHCESRDRAVFAQDGLNDEQAEVACKILLSITCLAENLNNVLKVNHIPAINPYGSQFLPRKRLEQSGWCQNAVAHFESQLTSPACLYFLGNMAPATVDGHVGCTPARCGRANLDESLYIREHAAACERNQCIDVVLEDCLDSPENDRAVSRLVNLQKIPVVTLRTGQKNPLIRVVASTDCSQYVAISHVWSE